MAELKTKSEGACKVEPIPKSLPPASANSEPNQPSLDPVGKEEPLEGQSKSASDDFEMVSDK